MKIALRGHQICNLFVGGDRRDKSLQSVIQGSPSKCFLLKKVGDVFHVWIADEVNEPPAKKDKPKIFKMSKKKKKNGKG